MDYQIGAAACPKCGSSEQVHTAREMLDTMGGVRDQAFQRLSQFRQSGQGQAQGQAAQGQGPAWNASGSAGDGDYDHYNVEGSDPNINVRSSSTSRRGDLDFGVDKVVDDIGGAVFGAALGFAGRAIGKRMKRAFEEKVMPAVEAKAAQAQQQWEQSKAEHDAIVARYPELRTCLADQVIFLEGGYQTVPMSELKAPVTLAQADDLVARLR